MSLEYDPSDIRDFNCEKMLLTSLEGAPQSVSGSFHCENNHLTSLKGAPQSVSGAFYCFKNQLTTLEGAPQYVGLGFYCDHNPRLSDEQINHYREFLKGQHQECLVDGHYMPPERLK